VRCNKSVGVSWVADYENLDVLLGVLVNSFSLSLKDFRVFIQKVFSLHTWTSGLGSYQDCNVSLVEGLFCLGGWNDVRNEMEGAVLELEDETLKGTFSNRELKELENNLLVGSKHATLCDHEA
jgi:hypothetical protein